jgi:RNA polymerase sigma-70 factor (ECF subfamily)
MFSLASHENNSSKGHRAWELVNKLSDEQVAQEILAGADDALTVLFDRHHKLVFGVAYKILHDAAEAEEVVQTVFLEVFRALVNFDPARGTLKVWLLQFAYSRALNRRRHLNAQRFYDLVSLDTPTLDGLADQWGNQADIARLVEELLTTLSPRRKVVLEMTYFEGMTANEIAERLGISADNVRHELYRGLGKLRKAMRMWRPVRTLPDPNLAEQGKEVLKPDAQPL